MTILFNQNTAIAVEESPKKSAFDFLAKDWEDYAKNAGMPKFRADQIKNWMFEHYAAHPDEMKNLPKDIKARLITDLSWELPSIHSRLDAADGASKLLLKGAKGQIFEAVILRYDGRTSLCVSSQVGCKLACSFCQTGKLGFFRHLSSAEILGQFLLACRIAQEENRRISHVVFMGMGEPLDNFEAVVHSCKAMTDSSGFNLSRSRVTVSTSGIAPKIDELAKELRVSLALSLHAARDDLRSELMPINNKYDLKILKNSLLSYQQITGDLITIEYILIKDKNCSRREAKDLVKFLHGIKAKVNLIPFNDHPGSAYLRPADDEIREFQLYLSQRGYPAPVRYSKGLDVSAACGQLAAKNKDLLDASPKRSNVVLT